MKYRRNSGFTLIELLVVITIIVVVAALSLPAVLDFVKKRRLAGAAQVIQMSCMQARSQAIAQRERHIVVFINDPNDTNIELFNGSFFSGAPFGDSGSRIAGEANTVLIIDTNENEDPTGAQMQIIKTEQLPKFVKYNSPGSANDPANFALVFFPNGSSDFVDVLNESNPPSDKANDSETSDDTDVIIIEEGVGVQCFMDITLNTGKTIFSIRNPLN